jgi:hypothetical protein
VDRRREEAMVFVGYADGARMIHESGDSVEASGSCGVNNERSLGKIFPVL